jgi:hypothetical protein
MCAPQPQPKGEKEMSDNELQPIRKKIVVDHTHNKHGDTGGMLQGCFFLPTGIKHFFNFYDQDGQTLATGVSSERPFPILLGDLAWTLECTIDDQQASGSWRNNGPSIADEQDGSFQASSGPGAEGEGESVSAEPPVGAVVINTVLGSSDKDKLKGMYFMQDPGPNNTWNLYNKNGKWIESGIQSGIGFTFQHDSFHPPGTNSQKIVWTVTDFVITAQAASGKWTNTDPGIAGEQGGSFQASSGPGADPEAASAASAY